MKNDWLYVALCLIVPPVWGLASARLYDLWHARRPKTPAATTAPDSDSVDMYHI